ncbi:MAG: hypothetical protein ACREL6_06385, partial [Gemmatimonadales bacterium]
MTRLRAIVLPFTLLLAAVAMPIAPAYAAPASAAAQDIQIRDSIVVDTPTVVGASAMDRVDSVVGVVNGWLATVFFANILWFIPGVNFPLVVFWLILGATYLTVRM